MRSVQRRGAARAVSGPVGRSREGHRWFRWGGGVLMVLGLGIVACSDDTDEGAANSNVVEPQAFSSHWHASYGVYICDQELPDADVHEYVENGVGIHSHQDGIIHIHPTSERAAGENARLGVYLAGSSRLDLRDDRIELNGETREEGVDTSEVDGEEVPGVAVVAMWEDVVVGGPPTVIEGSGLADLRFRQDGEGYMVAFVPDGTYPDIPTPASTSLIPYVTVGTDATVLDDADEDF